MSAKLKLLNDTLDGELHFDTLHRHIYATDASVYRELPLAVALPKHEEDIKTLVRFALQEGISLIPRAAGTSLAGQVVGRGMVVDISKYMNRILELNVEEGWVRVQPGVIRDELNQFLKPHGLFFGPDTSTANRCMLGGMVGNNSCGSTSIVYGSTRDHVLELKTVLSDASSATFSTLDNASWEEKLSGSSFENHLYRQTYHLLSQPGVKEEIHKEYPKPVIHRRNTGYAIDLLEKTAPFTPGGTDFNFCTLLCGSEGTLAFTTEIKLHLNPLPQPYDIVVCPHFHTLQACMEAVGLAMSYQPTACELMDKTILDCTKENREQLKNRFFVEGDPAAILMIEFRGDTPEEAEAKADQLIAALKNLGTVYAQPKIAKPTSKRIWDLRKAGLGVLANLPGEAKAVACIEDTAVAIADLPEYIREFDIMMKGFGQEAIYYAHAGAGEIHLRPVLDLKKEEDRQLFYDITEATARLVKKYGGSLSGEHGDGRVRAAFIPLMVGERNYELLKSIKQLWDPKGVFNPGKIVNAAPMNSFLRYNAGQETPDFDTVLDFSDSGGILQAAERCNGSGDCRKLAFAGGTMCPSYQATKDEKTTTRARANALREFLTMNVRENPFNHPELQEAMDLCLSCKGCTAECPSNVDMATLKAEFLYQYYKSNPISWRTRAFAHIATLNALGIRLSGLSNFILKNPITSGVLKKLLGVAPQRSLPSLGRQSLKSWFAKNQSKWRPREIKGKVWLFCDEFTNYNDVAIGIKAIQLLSKLGYEVAIPDHVQSGRAQFSKGLLDDARKLAVQNVRALHALVTDEQPIVGIEPSAILSFRDEYPRLVGKELKQAALDLGKNVFLIEEFLRREIEKGQVSASAFTDAPRQLLLHGHCHQKALTEMSDAAFVLSFPQNYTVEVIPSGCCGMAGSFGYEQEHYAVSMQVGELVLFPSIRKSAPEVVLAASGTSCRHQIADGTGRKAWHPVEILHDALS
ncbi:MAG TPA: FAD-linked oxidase C-terminal domain-containing protein [Saprospiraceae bacterium]|nr:FAD-linked oxidase C-terminal domain-containing protein [Saprospiraceae bacterium]HMQ82088.1 FAD-linked oxidase C-terminal domain-containing protein [Saprospiraceae bacterium]